MVDIAIIGGGPGGYTAALRAARAGKSVTLIDNAERLGGVCLNEGCIPSKALIHAASLFHEGKNAEHMGITSMMKLDLQKMQEWKESILDRLGRGISHLCRKADIQLIEGTASFSGLNTIKVNETEIQFKKAIIATGSVPIEIPGFSVDGERIASSKEALSLRKVPKLLTVVGGGPIGLELATVYAKLGSKVTVIEMMDQLLPGMDPELVKVVHRRLEKLGVDILLNAKAEKPTKEGILVEGDDIPSEVILIAVGRKPNTASLSLERAGIPPNDTGFISVDSQGRSLNRNIYAIGDVTGQPLLAHKASAQAKVAVDAILGKKRTLGLIPKVAYTDPEIASIGALEGEQITKLPFSALGRAHTMSLTDGMVKLVADAKGRLIGAHIVGPNASEMIAEAALAIEKELTLEDISFTVHPHPSLSEGLMEAADTLLEGDK